MEALAAASVDHGGEDRPDTRRRLPHGRVLTGGVVEDVAYWRRSHELRAPMITRAS
jgi:hypothetical protein